MIYKTIIIENCFSAGLVVGRLRSFLTSNEAGYIHIKGLGEGCVYLECSARNPAVMSFVEDQLAEFV